jgi:hypothetical protein
VGVLMSIIPLLVACQNTAPTHQILFDSGQGTGPYDKMTYPEYESQVIFTSQDNLTIKSITPQINYCNGSCGYIVMVYDPNGQVLAYQTGLIDAKDQSNPSLAGRYLNTPLQLNAQVAYLISIKVWTTESVGIYTTGDRTKGVLGEGVYEVSYARSNLVFPNGMPPNDTLDRGGIAFQFAD